MSRQNLFKKGSPLATFERNWVPLMLSTSKNSSKLLSPVERPREEIHEIFDLIKNEREENQMYLHSQSK